MALEPEAEANWHSLASVAADSLLPRRLVARIFHAVALAR